MDLPRPVASKSLFMRTIMRSKALHSVVVPQAPVASLSLVSYPVPFRRVCLTKGHDEQTQIKEAKSRLLLGVRGIWKGSKTEKHTAASLWDAVSKTPAIICHILLTHKSFQLKFIVADFTWCCNKLILQSPCCRESVVNAPSAGKILPKQKRITDKQPIISPNLIVLPWNLMTFYKIYKIQIMCFYVGATIRFDPYHIKYILGSPMCVKLELRSIHVYV